MEGFSLVSFKEEIDRIKTHKSSNVGGGDLFEYLIHPVTNKKISIYSKDGREMIKKYLVLYKNKV